MGLKYTPIHMWASTQQRLDKLIAKRKKEGFYPPNRSKVEVLHDLIEAEWRREERRDQRRKPISRPA